MMFSSNQQLRVSGECFIETIQSALDFALKLSGHYKNMTREEIERGCLLLYQITDDGKYCIGWGFKEIPEHWEKYPFDFDTIIVSHIIQQHLLNFDVEYDPDEGDGSFKKGFLMKNIERSFAGKKEDVKNPFYGIVSFEPYTCFYAK